ncbi:MAG: hypothetical protein GC171_09510 [Terrimonas sp.]|nr:hypothetical protein [Terrimonas sp.]
MAILGVAIVLFFIGIFGWLFLNASSYIKNLKEEVKVIVYLQDNAKQEDIDAFKQYIESKPYAKTIEYIDKEAAKKRFMDEDGSNFEQFLDGNPLPRSIEFFLKSDYVQKDTLINIKNDLSQNILLVQGVEYPAYVVEKMGSIIQWILIGLIILAVIFAILSIILIDNTVRLAMYSNRFLIKTMQMVGATRGFISKPMNIKAVINGTVAALIAIGIILGIILLFESFIPYLKDLRNNSKLILLFLVLLVVGVGISLFSTQRSVTKYLRMKLDDLY